MSDLRVVVHPAQLRVAIALAQLLGDVEVVANRHVPLGDVWLLRTPPTEIAYQGFVTQVPPIVDLPPNKGLITKTA
jgi:hypothetical protein